MSGQLDKVENVVGLLKLRRSGVRVGALSAFDRYSDRELLAFALQALTEVYAEAADAEASS